MNKDEATYDDLAEIWAGDPDGGYLDHDEIDPKLFEKLRRSREVKDE